MMKLIILIAMSILSLSVPLRAEAPDTAVTKTAIKRILQCRIPPHDKRYPTFRYALEEIIKRDLKIIVETGTARNGARECLGDGCSTIIWSSWAKEFGGSVYSIDVDPAALQNSAHGCARCSSHVEFICQDSVECLKSFEKQIDFLYLDSYDYDPQDPDPSQQHHLNEIMAAYPRLHEQSLVMIDDCDLPQGGKGKLVIEYLLERGWKIALSGYQVVMIFER